MITFQQVFTIVKASNLIEDHFKQGLNISPLIQDAFFSETYDEFEESTQNRKLWYKDEMETLDEESAAKEIENFIFYANERIARKEQRNNELKKQAQVQQSTDKFLNLPELSGSEKQIPWAVTIRSEFLKGVSELTLSYLTKKSGFSTKAKFFIDNRSKSASEFNGFFEQYNALAINIGKLKKEIKALRAQTSRESNELRWNKEAELKNVEDQLKSLKKQWKS